MLKKFIIVTFALMLVSCALPKREAPKELGVQQVQAHGIYPSEYVFCDVAGGAWGCKSVTKKTRIDHDPMIDSKNNKKKSINSFVKNEINKLKKVEKKNKSKKTTTIASHLQNYDPPKKPRNIKNDRNSDNANKSKFLVLEKVAGNIKKTDKKLPKGQPAKVIYFAFNSSFLNSASKRKLLAALDYLKGKRLEIYGYTDNVGSKKYNDWLAFRRAERIASFLKRKKIGASIKTYGYGLCCYVKKNIHESQRKQNRRVEIYVTK